MSNPFRYFNGSPDVIRLVVMMYVRYALKMAMCACGSCRRGGVEPRRLM